MLPKLTVGNDEGTLGMLKHAYGNNLTLVFTYISQNQTHASLNARFLR